MKVYGTSDDLVELEGSKYQENEIVCYGSDVIKRHGKVMVICSKYPNHKQRQG